MRLHPAENVSPDALFIQLYESGLTIVLLQLYCRLRGVRYDLGTYR